MISTVILRSLGTNKTKCANSLLRFLWRRSRTFHDFGNTTACYLVGSLLRFFLKRIWSSRMLHVSRPFSSENVSLVGWRWTKNELIEFVDHCVSKGAGSLFRGTLSIVSLNWKITWFHFPAREWRLCHGVDLLAAIPRIDIENYVKFTFFDWVQFYCGDKKF